MLFSDSLHYRSHVNKKRPPVNSDGVSVRQLAALPVIIVAAPDRYRERLVVEASTNHTTSGTEDARAEKPAQNTGSVGW